MGATLSQLFPPAPGLTETNLPSQKGKVFAITGGTSGVGFELAKILYYAGGTVFITSRSTPSLAATIKQIKSEALSESEGDIDGVVLDLADLSTIKQAAEALLAKTRHIDVLFLNAGVSQPPPGITTAQGYELQLGVNCLGHFLLAHILLPALVTAADKSKERQEVPGTTRIIWTSSQVVDGAPTGGFPMSVIVTPPAKPIVNYTNSKLGNWYLASYFSTLPQVRNSSILSITQNPGNMKTNLMRHGAKWMYYLAFPLLYPGKMGAYTELWAGLSSELGMLDAGGYVVPWGRKHPGLREDLLKSLKSKENGGTGRAEEFAAWCEEQVKDFR
ncbi:NAD(P)-binding protein [Lindgomyces ingoldianus]|uniref:NAD(P)-binding protein n=1 Tax=Lindgomyces ingoldianus TaxID=673940 RepID=A0ACB6QQ28_9PLEO|nr:NAD(P)-binding protein [Lindgomyces ingoldianus]KAF2469114.1 NAD(P)-binding protein [Lindgomyces ingoldianus]